MVQNTCVPAVVVRKEEAMYCTRCGNQVAAGAVFCAACGQQVRQDSTRAAVGPADEDAEVLAAALGRRGLGVKVAVVVTGLVACAAVAGFLLWHFRVPDPPANMPVDVARYFVDRINDGRLEYLPTVVGKQFYLDQARRCRISESCKDSPQIGFCMALHKDGPEVPSCSRDQIEKDLLDAFRWVRSSGRTPCVVKEPLDGQPERLWATLRCGRLEDSFAVARVGDRWMLDGTGDGAFPKLREEKLYEDLARSAKGR